MLCRFCTHSLNIGSYTAGLNFDSYANDFSVCVNPPLFHFSFSATAFHISSVNSTIGSIICLKASIKYLSSTWIWIS